MKKTSILTMAIVLVISVFGFSFVFGQTNTAEKTVFQPTFKVEDTVTTVDGDSLWGYAESDYDRLIAMNPELNLKKVVRGAGDVYVLLPVGVTVKGVKRVLASSVTQTPTATPTPTPSPSPSPSPTPVLPVASETTFFSSLFGFFVPMLWWLLLLALLAALAYAIFVIWFNRNRRGAANAGPRFEQNGINDRNATDAFARQYANERVGVGPTFEVRNLRRRRASGAITVAYNNGTSQTRVLDNEVVYIADLHYSDQTVRRDQMLLSACGNPLRTGGNVLSYAPGLNFRFVDDRPAYIQPVTEEQETAANTQPANLMNVLFDGEMAVVTTNGKSVPVIADENATFSRLNAGEAETLPSIRVKINNVFVTFRDGVIVDVQAEPIQLPGNSPVALLGTGTEPKTEATATESKNE